LKHIANQHKEQLRIAGEELPKYSEQPKGFSEIFENFIIEII